MLPRHRRAVIAIFAAVPLAKDWFAGYPLPPGLPEVLSVSLACGVALRDPSWFVAGEVGLFCTYLFVAFLFATW